VPFNQGRLRNAWWFDYSGGILTNWAIHHIDSILWAMQADTPSTAVCTGGKFVIDDMADTPDTLEATWEFPGWVLQYRYRGYSNFRPFLSRPKSHGLCFHGTRATMLLDRDGFEIWDDQQFDSWNRNPEKPVEVVKNVPILPEGIGNESDGNWQRLFIERLRGGKPSPLSLEESHRATVCCHLANISYHSGRKIRWNGKGETISGDGEASRLLARPRRSNYKLPPI
jgi:predicted dehydrogenase